MQFLTPERAEGFAVISPRLRPALNPWLTMISGQKWSGVSMWRRTPWFG